MAQQKVLPQYRGRLSPEQASAGMNAAGRNAKRLLEDAELLFKAGRYASASSLAILSIEESGKLSIIRGITTAPDDEALKQAWKDYRDHKAKNAPWIIGDLVSKGARTLNDLAPIFDKKSDHPILLELVKQLGLYTDCLGMAHWSEPTALADEELASRNIALAQVLLPKQETSVREMELWVHYVAPHWGTAEMAGAALEFQRAVVREGLVSHTELELDIFFSVSPKE